MHDTFWSVGSFTAHIKADGGSIRGGRRHGSGARGANARPRLKWRSSEPVKHDNAIHSPFGENSSPLGDSLASSHPRALLKQAEFRGLRSEGQPSSCTACVRVRLHFYACMCERVFLCVCMHAPSLCACVCVRVHTCARACICAFDRDRSSFVI